MRKPILGEMWERSIWRRGTWTTVLSQRAVSYYLSRETSVCWKCDMKLPTIPLCPRINLAALHHLTVAASFRRWWWGGGWSESACAFCTGRHLCESTSVGGANGEESRGLLRPNLEEWDWADKNFVRDDRLSPWARLSSRDWRHLQSLRRNLFEGGGKVSKHFISCYVNFGNNFHWPVSSAPLWQLMV